MKKKCIILYILIKNIYYMIFFYNKNYIKIENILLVFYFLNKKTQLYLLDKYISFLEFI